MTPSRTFLTTGALLSVAASVAASNVVGFEFTKIRVNYRDVPHLEARHPHLSRRSDTVQATITNELLLYLINVTVGTPPQAISLQLDTGSSDIWFPATSADICQQESLACSLGTYNSSASSTGKDIGRGEFQIQYVDGSLIQGDYISDVLNIGSTKLTNMTMAAATTASRGIGIMGIGYQSGESIAELTGQTYPDVINILMNEGKTSSLAYSLWLDDVNANTGSILFGAVDTSKYTGSLAALPIQNDAQTRTLTSFTVAWTGLTSTGGGKTVTYAPSSSAIPAILDSGTTDILLPDDVANSIYNAVGVTTDPNYGNIVPCSIAHDDLTFTFTFGGPDGATIKVPLSELVVPLLTTDGSITTVRGQEACSFAVNSAGSDPILLEYDAFLRSAYIVYDLGANMIGLAQTNFNPGSSDIQEISSGIPDVSKTASAVTVTQTFSGIPLQTGAATSAAGTSIISRSATLSFATSSLTSSSSSGSSTRSGTASSGFSVPGIQRITVLVGLATFAGVVFGGVAFLI